MKQVDLDGLALMLMAVLLAGCKPPEPQTPAPNAAPESAKPQASDAAKPQAAEPAKPQAAAPPETVAPAGPQLVAPANEPQEPIAQADESGPQEWTAFYRADAGRAEIPPVVLSKAHEDLCRVKVGDTMPAIELPQLGDDGNRKKLSELVGEKVTVVVFWKSDRRMALEQLADLGPDVIDPFGEAGAAVVGIAVNESPSTAQAALRKAGATFANLLDADGKAFAQVGSEKLPRTYLLDPHGKILWFDIEYSLATRRELHQALRAVAGPAGDEKQE